MANLVTHFLGYDHDHTGADVLEVTSANGKPAVVLNNSVCYAEMGGQVGDTGEMSSDGQRWKIADTRKAGGTWLHLIEGEGSPSVGEHVTVRFEKPRRQAIERHHTVTHLLHWALHESRFARGGAKRELCRAGEVDVRFFERGADARSRSGKWADW